MLFGKHPRDSNEHKSIRKEWTAKKEQHAKKRLDEIFLDFQKDAMQEWNCWVEIRRFGVHAALARGILGDTLKISSSQKKLIEDEAKGLAERYKSFAQSTADWYFDELVKDVDEGDREKLDELFNHDLRILKLPVGCLSLASKRNGIGG